MQRAYAYAYARAHTQLRMQTRARFSNARTFSKLAVGHGQVATRPGLRGGVAHNHSYAATVRRRSKMHYRYSIGKRYLSVP